MLEWLYEAGIGEARAALVDGDTIIEAHIEPDDDGLRAGTVCDARLTEILIPAKRGIVTCAAGEALLEPIPKGTTLGGMLKVEISRGSIPEPGVAKRAKARPAAAEAVNHAGPDLLTRLTTTGLPARHLSPHDPDAFESAGWSECLEDARAGRVVFAGGTLRISLTPAMTLIDVDGHLPPSPLALASARAAAATVRRFGISGSIGIDFPTLANKSERLATADAFDDVLPLPFERTAINGFGFLQIIRPRARASLCEQLNYERVPSATRALLRRVQRAGIIGAATIVAHPLVLDQLVARRDWLDTLSGQLGGALDLRADASLAIGSGYVSKV